VTSLVTYQNGAGPAVGVLADGQVHATGHTDMMALIAAGPQAWSALSGGELGPAVDDARLLAPLPSPGKLLFCGVNYPGHLEENPGAVLPETPFFFSKLPSAVVGPEADIVIPAPETDVDYEVELAVVIGRRARNLTRENALEHVFGYTVVNDVSARDVQFKDNQITLGKNPDTFCPMGPSIVLADKLGDPQSLGIRARVNGEERQSDVTSNMIFDIPRLLEVVSSTITLEPGDIVTTGTPAGVGCFRNPPLWLEPGDRVEVEVDGIGTLGNPVVAAW
jgi:2-keto-4-pentenoate hydratase/2-oxohepta-3-ene-1,7-dioic acid hydratase in catechol pathway